VEFEEQITFIDIIDCQKQSSNQPVMQQHSGTGKSPPFANINIKSNLRTLWGVGKVFGLM